MKIIDLDRPKKISKLDIDPIFGSCFASCVVWILGLLISFVVFWFLFS